MNRRRLAWGVAGSDGARPGEARAGIMSEVLLRGWFMNGSAQTGGSYLSPSQVAANWKVAGVRDFNHDGKPDILWRDTSGYLYVWYMNGTTQVGGEYLSPSQVAVDWDVYGVE